MHNRSPSRLRKTHMRPQIWSQSRTCVCSAVRLNYSALLDPTHRVIDDRFSVWLFVIISFLFFRHNNFWADCLFNEFTILISEKRQTMLFSATSTKKTEDLVKLALKKEPISVGLDENVSRYVNF